VSVASLPRIEIVLKYNWSRTINQNEATCSNVGTSRFLIS